MSDNRVLITEVNEFPIYSNSLYKVIHKADKNAPSGFIAEGATKLPSVGIGNSVSCHYISRGGNGSHGVWDTGFYEKSPCYSTTDEASAKKVLTKLSKYIVEPYETFRSQEKLLNQNSDFWDSYLIDLYEGRVFNTSRPEELLALYIAVLGNHLTPKGLEGSPKFSNADYCIVDLEQAKSVREERSTKVMTTGFEFMSMLKSDPTELQVVLTYLGIGTGKGALDKDIIVPLFHEWLNADIDRADEFQRILKMLESDDSKETVYLFSKLREAVRTKKVQKTAEGHYVLNGEFLGGDLKSAARNLATNKELEESKIELLEG
jgi:hypothetical protein